MLLSRGNLRRKWTLAERGKATAATSSIHVFAQL